MRGNKITLSGWIQYVERHYANFSDLPKHEQIKLFNLLRKTSLITKMKI